MVSLCPVAGLASARAVTEAASWPLLHSLDAVSLVSGSGTRALYTECVLEIATNFADTFLSNPLG